MIRPWLIRLACCIPLLLLVALTVKWYMVEPYSYSVIDFEIAPAMKKGDREI